MFTVGQVYTDLVDYMGGRNLSTAKAYEWIRKSVLELTETYKFPDVQATGPVTQLTQFNPGPYTYNQFMQPADAGLDITNIDSFFIYYETPIVLAGSNGENPGIQLVFRTIDTIELAMNIVGQPIYWTRYNGAIYVAFAPELNYSIYARYRKMQSFSTPVASSDPIYMPNTWQDIVGYCAAERGSISLNLMDRANDFHIKVFGDPKFQVSGGSEGAPGLIFMRTSQEQRDKTRSYVQMRPRMQHAGRR